MNENKDRYYWYLVNNNVYNYTNELCSQRCHLMNYEKQYAYKHIILLTEEKKHVHYNQL